MTDDDAYESFRDGRQLVRHHSDSLDGYLIPGRPQPVPKEQENDDRDSPASTDLQP